MSVGKKKWDIKWKEHKKPIGSTNSRKKKKKEEAKQSLKKDWPHIVLTCAIQTTLKGKDEFGRKLVRYDYRWDIYTHTHIWLKTCNF